jgi:osmotically-inducible protein OsmY
MIKELGWSQLLVVSVMAMGLMGFSGDPRGASDIQIETVSLERLRADTRLDATKITVVSEQHKVNLAGTVPRLEDKYLAERIVGSTIVGVRSITNSIEVVPTADNG